MPLLLNQMSFFFLSSGQYSPKKFDIIQCFKAPKYYSLVALSCLLNPGGFYRTHCIGDYCSRVRGFSAHDFREYAYKSARSMACGLAHVHMASNQLVVEKVSIDGFINVTIDGVDTAARGVDEVARMAAITN